MSAVDVTTVGPDLVVMHAGTTVRRFEGLAADTVHELDGIDVRTLPDPGGELLCRFATVNDVHFGETECGLVEDAPEVGPVLSVDEDEDPYPETMNRGAISEMAAIDPAAVIVKGDLTSKGTEAEYQDFLAAYEPAFGDRLIHVRGNHDAYHGQDFAAVPVQRLDLPGVTIAVLDTTVAGKSSGSVSAEQLEWLEHVAADAPGRVLVFGHHHVWDPGSPDRDDSYFGVHPDPSEALVALAARHDNVLAYFAGHTHRNRSRRFTSTGDMRWVEVACVKDFPGAWAEYRVHEGGIVQLVHRISTRAALDWSERTRAMYLGHYADYAFGSLDDRCFLVTR